MRRSTAVYLAGAAAALLALLLFDFHVAYVMDEASANQSVSTASGIILAPVGNELLVYLGGDRTLAHPLERAVTAAILAKDLGFQAVRFVSEIPADSVENPFLAIQIVEDGGLWTPLVARRQVKATMLYQQNLRLDRDAVIQSLSGSWRQFMRPETCAAGCVDGDRRSEVSVQVVGLVSLPHMRTEGARKVAAEAAVLVTEALPEHRNPEKWASRVHDLTMKQFATSGGGFSTFRRLDGCRGGIGLAGGMGAGADWGVVYYDAEKDAITSTLTRSEVQAQHPEIQVWDAPPGFGGTDGQGVQVYVEGVSILTIPPGTCGLTGR